MLKAEATATMQVHVRETQIKPAIPKISNFLFTKSHMIQTIDLLSPLC